MAEWQLLSGLVCALLVGLLVLLVSVPPVPRQRRTPAGGFAAQKFTAQRSSARSPAQSCSAERSASPRAPDAATLLDLTAAMLRAGVGIDAAVQRLGEDVPGCAPLARVHRGLAAGQQWKHAWSCVAGDTPLREYGQELAFAHATGAPTAELLELTATQARRRRRRAVEEQAARLGVQMVLPLGLCFLPGFILIGVIPVVLGMVQELT
ncbi:type II secretion system F family protein [Nesterenkonia sandarakina]|uniref:Type II secretion system protein GspF domain-containing protein n=1 Tax=Nesterenkonia sandarakina TaxID=272918 RepID=A0A7Z0J2W3_9MICC|nr:type II secretion system F family protein [Nesterenkonia sandarakina]NYJ16118.1 hypothetical protein [Nesterenkonia sandarakina]